MERVGGSLSAWISPRASCNCCCNCCVALAICSQLKSAAWVELLQEMTGRGLPKD
jgi:hypothetical protein